jgi:hypothetical protein
MTDPNNNSADVDPTVVLPRRKKRPSAYRAGDLEAKITSTFIRTALSQSPTLRPKPASSSLDRVSPVPTADSWAVRWGSAVCAVLAGFQVSDPNQASADRYVVGYDFLDLTFYFSFAGVAGELLQSYSACFRRLTGTAAQFARRRSGFEEADMFSPPAHLSGTERGTAEHQLSRTQDHAPDGPA